MLSPTVSLQSLLNALKAAGEDTRLRLLALLSEGELTVSELSRILGQSAPRVSRHLKLLCENHLLERHQEGSWVFYRVADRGPAAHIVRAVLALLPANDPDLERDSQRLAAIRAEHARTASEYFESIAGKWDAMRALYIPESRIEEKLLALAGESPIGQMVDLGTGTGRILEVFSPYVDRGLGIDLSREMLGVARANLERAGITNCQVRQGDLFNLKIDNGSTHLAVLHHVLHYLDDPGTAILEAGRILAPGGRLLIVDFSPHDLEYLRKEQAHRRLGFADEEITSWFRDAGLSLHELKKLAVDSPQDNPTPLTVTLWVGTRNPR